MARLFVTGRTGYLGGEVARVAAAGGWEVVPPARVETRDAQAVRAAMAAEGPDAVVHSAYRQDGETALQTNVDGSLNVARAAREVGARLVHVSSDVIFRGDAGLALTEADPVDPITDYGRTKAAAEVVVRASDPGAVSRLEFAQLVAAAHGLDPSHLRGEPRPDGRPGDLTLDCSRAAGLLRTRPRGVREVLGRPSVLP